MLNSVNWTSGDAGAGMRVGAVVNMNAILYENRSHYYYGNYILDSLTREG
jgi:hypothetical protein